MKTFEHEDKTYTIKNGFVYQLDKGLFYTPVEKGSTLENIARNYGFKQNITDAIGDGFHIHEYKAKNWRGYKND